MKIGVLSLILMDLLNCQTQPRRKTSFFFLVDEQGKPPKDSDSETYTDEEDNFFTTYNILERLHFVSDLL